MITPKKKVCRWKTPMLDRFWFNVKKTSGCWLWTGKKIGGYGKIRNKGVEYSAHRYSYEIHKGPIPIGLFVCHTCDNPSCVNPDHLWVGTNHENVLDSCRKGRRAAQHCEHNHHAKLTSKQVLLIRRLAKQGIRHKILAKRFSVSQSHISNLARGVFWDKLSDEA